MERIDIPGLTTDDSLDGAHIIQQEGRIIARYPEPVERAQPPGLGYWSPSMEEAWREAVRGISRLQWHDVYIQWDPGRDNASDELI